MRKVVCSKCGAPMVRLYQKYHDKETGKKGWAGVAWFCTNPACELIERLVD